MNFESSLTSRSAGHFTAEIEIDTSLEVPTEIHLWSIGEESWYPNGFDYQITPEEAQASAIE